MNICYLIGWAEDGYWGFDFRDGIDLDYSANGSYSTELFAARAEKIIAAHDVKKVCPTCYFRVIVSGYRNILVPS